MTLIEYIRILGTPYTAYVRRNGKAVIRNCTPQRLVSLNTIAHHDKCYSVGERSRTETLVPLWTITVFQYLKATFIICLH